MCWHAKDTKALILSHRGFRSAVQHGSKLPEILAPFMADLLKEAQRRIHLSFIAVMNSKTTSGKFNYD